ncbi:MAG TPA: hypothetical protein VFP80_09975 [Thermoanaerobaculia bacterium]|nr:hypothetical protein [Thermoanaerobaculia bacterium]
MKSALLCTVLLAVTAAAQEHLALREGILVDPSRPVAYVMTPEGGVAAIDLQTGATEWSTMAAARPLVLVGDLLLCQQEPATAEARHNLLLVVLDVVQKGAVTAGASVELPDSVWAAVTETLRGTLYVEGRRTGSGTAAVLWQFVPALVRGTTPSPEEDALTEDLQLETGGAARMNLVTGDVKDIPLRHPEIGRQPAWVIAGSENDDQSSADYRSVDRKHILRSERIADDRTWAKYQWTIRAKTGRKVGSIRTFLAFTPFVVRQNVLVFDTTPYAVGDDVQPAKLRGFRLATGKEVWSVPVREFVFRGPTPP